MKEALLLLILLLGAGCSSLQPNYVSVRGGASQLQDHDVEACCLGGIDYELGKTASLAVGRHLDNGVSIEVEALASMHDASTVKMPHRRPHHEVDGEFQTFGLFGNGYYTFGRKNKWPIQPYVGAGLGAMMIHANINDITCTDRPTGCGREIERRLSRDELSRGWSNVVPAAQLMVGFTIPIIEALELFTEAKLVRALGTPKVSGGETGQWFTGGSEWETETWNLLAGLRWRF